MREELQPYPLSPHPTDFGIKQPLPSLVHLYPLSNVEFSLSHNLATAIGDIRKADRDASRTVLEENCRRIHVQSSAPHPNPLHKLSAALQPENEGVIIIAAPVPREVRTDREQREAKWLSSRTN